MDLTARVQGTFYTRCALPLDEGGLREIDNATYAFADGEIDASSHVYSQEMLTEYRKGIGRGIVYALNPGLLRATSVQYEALAPQLRSKLTQPSSVRGRAACVN